MTEVKALCPRCSTVNQVYVEGGIVRLSRYTVPSAATYWGTSKTCKQAALASRTLRNHTRKPRAGHLNYQHNGQAFLVRAHRVQCWGTGDPSSPLRPRPGPCAWVGDFREPRGQEIGRGLLRRSGGQPHRARLG